MRFVRFAFLVGSLAATLAACEPAIPPVGNYANVSGRVTDAKSGSGVPNVTITVNSVLSATTDAGGSYRIPTVPTGPWSYAVSAPAGYLAPAPIEPPQLGPGESRILDIVLTPR